MRGLFTAALVATSTLLTNVAFAQEMPCEDASIVRAAFAEQGTIYRGTTQGPNHYLVHIFENVGTGLGIALHYDPHHDQYCVESTGFSYAALANRATITPPSI